MTSLGHLVFSMKDLVFIIPCGWLLQKIVLYFFIRRCFFSILLLQKSNSHVAIKSHIFYFTKIEFHLVKRKIEEKKKAHKNAKPFEIPRSDWFKHIYVIRIL